MAWPLISLRDRRRQARDDIATSLPGADANVPNAPLRVMGDAMANMVHDNDRHLDWVAKMMMPDTAEGEYADRWADIWLEDGRKPATFAAGTVTVTGSAGASVATGAELAASVVDPITGKTSRLVFTVAAGVTLAASSAEVGIEAVTAGRAGNLEEGARLAWTLVPDGIDGQAVVVALAGGADAETDADLIARYIDRIQEPPHGGNAHDYVQWLLAIPGVTRAWCSPREMGVGTVTLRFMMDAVRSGGFPLEADLAVVAAVIDAKRPVTVAQVFVVAPIAQAMSLTIANLVGDTPETRAAIATEIDAMLLSRGAPGQRIYASWIREAVSAATGEDHHQLTVSDVVPASAGHIITRGTITYA